MNRFVSLQPWVPGIVLCVTCAQLAWAGDDPPTAAPESAAAAKAKNLAPVIVTGTHVRGVDTATAQPVQTITREQIAHTGLTSVADVAQSLIVANGPTLNRNINNGSEARGQLRVNLRSLGANRTLVLVNGQRWVSALDGAVDLSAIPLSMVDHIDVLKDGASAVYGSDAIGGVINIVTRPKVDHPQLGVYAGVNEHGDGTRSNIDFAFGHDGEATRWSIGLEAGKDDPIMASARTISAVPALGLPLAATGALTTPYGVFTVDGLGNVVLIPGRTGTSPDDFRRFHSATDSSFNYQAYSYLQTPQERRAGFAQFRRELTPSLALVADAIIDRRTSSQQLAPPTIHFSTAQFTGEQAYTVSPDSIYNPFGADVAVHMRFVGADVRRFEQAVNTSRLHLGLDGSFTLAGHDWNWTADAISTRAAQTEFSGPYADNEKLRLAVGPSYIDASGTPRCGSPGHVIAGCVPIDLFGGPERLTPAMLDYVDVNVHNRTSTRSDLFALHADGQPFTLPAGPLGMAIGIERRIEHGRDDPDLLVATDRANGTGVSYEPTRGSYAVNEAFVEFDAPLLANRPLARQLDLNVATRWSHYSLFGGTANTRVALKWRPFTDLLVRATHTQGFRAPSVLEAFGGTVYQHYGNGYFDDCAVQDDYQPPADVAARCAAAGVPPDVPPPIEVDTISTSNATLKPETTSTLTAGVLFSPRWLPGLDVSVDWYRIKLRNAIADPGGQWYIDACYLHGDPNACARIARYPDGTLQYVTTSERNLFGRLQTDGVDFALAWKRQTDWGDFNLRWETAWVGYYGEIGKPASGSTLADGSFAEGNVVGSNDPVYGVVWRTRSVATLDWQRGRWGAAVTGRYFSPIFEYCNYIVYIGDRLHDPSLVQSHCSDPNHMSSGFGSDTPFPDPRNRLGSVTYIDLEGRWKAPWNAVLSLGVRNAFDRQPPHAWSYSGSGSFIPDYDVPGRFWYFTYRQTF
ncbi:MAG: TonB-dependent receptor [Proteobacteria bacterium]|nr:TonB-dependent receptor [Pseudomonadota bacterium]